MSIAIFRDKFLAKEKITMLTCYDFTFAKILSETNLDAILVGDSLSMVMHGKEDTTKATHDLMCLHTKAVRSGLKNKTIIADMAFLTYRQSLDKSVEYAGDLIRSGANAVKIEGADGNIDCTKHLVESGIPVMGHLGLTPQFIHQFGGWKVQAKTNEAKEKLLQDAKALEKAGCFSIVLECVPSDIAKQVQEKLNIPCIGIGAGADTAGQILVLQDMLGLQNELQPKFVRNFANLKSASIEGIQSYIQAVEDLDYPSKNESYK